jgi:hypothetical protein
MYEDFSAMNADVMDPSKPLLGAECDGCLRVFPYSYFQKDASRNSGVSALCNSCAATPRLSVAEHLKRLQEQNFGSEQAKRIRGEDPESWLNSRARVGRQLHSADFLRILTGACPDLLIAHGYVSETGRVEDADLTLYRVYPGPQAHLDGREYNYIGFCHRGVLPEFSIWNFGKMGERTEEARRGWRTILLRCIQVGMLSEEKAHKLFGHAEGEAGYQYRKQLYAARNRK